MIRFIIRRLFQTVFVLFVIFTITFFMIRLAPGGPFDSEKVASPEVLRALNERYHLNDPLWKQYVDYLGSVARLDMGPSFKYPGRSVNELIGDSLPFSVHLGLMAFLLAIIVGVTAGVLSAIKKNTMQDYTIMTLAMIGICLPTFVLGPVLILLFALTFEIFNTSGWDQPMDWVLPTITLASPFVANIARLARGSMLEILSQDFIRTARSKGLSSKKIITRHALRGAIPPVVSYLGPVLGSILTGSLVVETIFDIPGIGRFFVQAAFNRDYTFVMGIVLLSATFIIIMNLISDILLVLLDPRLSFEK